MFEEPEAKVTILEEPEAKVTILEEPAENVDTQVEEMKALEN